MNKLDYTLFLTKDRMERFKYLKEVYSKFNGSPPREATRNPKNNEFGFEMNDPLTCSYKDYDTWHPGFKTPDELQREGKRLLDRYTLLFDTSIGIGGRWDRINKIRRSHPKLIIESRASFFERCEKLEEKLHNLFLDYKKNLEK